MKVSDLVALPFQWGSALRGKKFFHPVGVVARRFTQAHRASVSGPAASVVQCDSPNFQGHRNTRGTAGPHRSGHPSSLATRRPGTLGHAACVRRFWRCDAGTGASSGYIMDGPEPDHTHAAGLPRKEMVAAGPNRKRNRRYRTIARRRSRANRSRRHSGGDRASLWRRCLRDVGAIDIDQRGRTATGRGYLVRSGTQYRTWGAALSGMARRSAGQCVCAQPGRTRRRPVRRSSGTRVGASNPFSWLRPSRCRKAESRSG